MGRFSSKKYFSYIHIDKISVFLGFIIFKSSQKMFTRKKIAINKWSIDLVCECVLMELQSGFSKNFMTQEYTAFFYFGRYSWKIDPLHESTHFMLTHVQEYIHVCKKLSKSISIIKKVKNILTSDTLKTLYNSLILPYINYCCQVWGNTSN